jgi:hypothetical protein
VVVVGRVWAGAVVAGLAEPVAELITERIRRNATELRLHGDGEDPDELLYRAEADRLGYREFLDRLLESDQDSSSLRTHPDGAATRTTLTGGATAGRHGLEAANRRVGDRASPGRTDPGA